MEYTYHIEGTFSKLQELMQSQFAMDQETAKFSVCLLIMDQQQFTKELDELHDSLWYLDKHEHFTTPVFKSRFSISFTDAKRNILDQLAVQFGGMLVDGDSFAFSTILSCLLALYRSSTFIKDDECCTYYQALNWKATHGKQEYFRVSDILPVDPENVCSHLDFIKDQKWKCCFCHAEKCSATDETFSTMLERLRQNYIKCIDWILQNRYFCSTIKTHGMG